MSADESLRERLRIETRKLEAVRELSRVLGATLDLDRLLLVLLEKVTEILDAERATIFLRTDDGELESSVAQGGAIAPIRLKRGEGIAGWVADSGQTVNIPDAYSDERFHKEIERIGGQPATGAPGERFGFRACLLDRKLAQFHDVVDGG